MEIEGRAAEDRVGRLGATSRSGDDGATRMQILSTEHWSLLATRSLGYSESLSRVSMFLSVLSGAIISLALIAQSGRLGQTFVVAAILLLSVVVFVGLATIGRITAINRTDLGSVAGMNRIRHAYLEMHPDLEPYFVASPYDDFRGLMQTIGVEGAPGQSWRRDFLHGLQTLPGMMGVIVAVVAGTLAALMAVFLSAPEWGMVVTGVAVFLVTLASTAVVGGRGIVAYMKRMRPLFPTP